MDILELLQLQKDIQKVQKKVKKWKKYLSQQKKIVSGATGIRTQVAWVTVYYTYHYTMAHRYSLVSSYVYITYLLLRKSGLSSLYSKYVWGPYEYYLPYEY